MKTYLLSLASFFCLFSNAQKTSQNIKTYPIENSLLWKIDGNGLQEASYLFGTMHMICKEGYSLAPFVLEALKNTDEFYLEIDMDDPNLYSEIQKLSISSEKLSEKLSEEDLEFVDAFLKEKMGIGVSKLDLMKPSFIYSLTMLKAFDCPTLSIENELIKTKETDVKGLESASYQLSMLDKSISYDNLVASLKSSEEQDLMEMANAYTHSNLQKIQDITIDSMKESDDMYHNLLVERNQNWVDKMPEIMAEKATFFGVGAAHLITEKGLIKLLRDKGYTVTAVQ